MYDKRSRTLSQCIRRRPHHLSAWKPFDEAALRWNRPPSSSRNPRKSQLQALNSATAVTRARSSAAAQSRTQHLKGSSVGRCACPARDWEQPDGEVHDLAELVSPRLHDMVVYLPVWAVEYPIMSPSDAS